MSLLSYLHLVELVKNGVITNVEPGQINSSSIDLTLGENILVETPSPQSKFEARAYVRLDERQPLNMTQHRLTDSGVFWLAPGQFILAETEQKFFLPRNISAEYKLKSSMARIGLEHLNAGWCDAGWNNSVLTLELKNMSQHHAIGLTRGVGIGQIVFFAHIDVPHEASYAKRGRYNGDAHVSEIKP